jgi:GTP:adenosylcobinamide-phosphate guanylyltransferase
MKAFILAGGKGNIDFEDCDNKALLPIEGKFMLQYIVDALRGSTFIDGIAIIGDPDLLRDKIEIDNDKDIILQEDEMMIDNVVKGLNYFLDQEKVLLITSDIPFITPKAIDHFIQASLDSKADFTYPIIKKETQLQTYPDMQRTYVKLKEGSFTGGNMSVIKPDIGDPFFAMGRHMIENRKKPWKMVKILGVGFLVQLLLGTLTIEKLENRIGSLLSINPKAIITPYAEIGNDVDKKEDIELAKKYIDRYKVEANRD